MPISPSGRHIKCMTGQIMSSNVFVSLYWYVPLQLYCFFDHLCTKGGTSDMLSVMISAAASTVRATTAVVLPNFTGFRQLSHFTVVGFVVIISRSSHFSCMKVGKLNSALSMVIWCTEVATVFGALLVKFEMLLNLHLREDHRAKHYHWWHNSVVWSFVQYVFHKNKI